MRQYILNEHEACHGQSSSFPKTALPRYGHHGAVRRGLKTIKILSVGSEQAPAACGTFEGPAELQISTVVRSQTIGPEAA